MANAEVGVEAQASTLDEVFQIVWKRAWLVVVCVAISLAGGYAYYTRAVPIYQVTARLLVEHEKLPLDDRRSPARFEEEFIATQAQIVSSPAVVNPVVEAVGWISENPDKEDATESLLKCLTVKPISGTNLLDISFRSPQTEQSIQAVEAIIESYCEYLGQLDQDSYQETLTLLTKKEQETRAELETLEEQHRELREQGLLVGYGRETHGIRENALVALGRELNEAKNRRIELENGLRVLAAGSPRNDGRVLRLASTQGAHDAHTRSAILHVGEEELREPIDEDLAVLAPLMNQLQIQGYRSLEERKQKHFEALDRQRTLSKIYAKNNVTMLALREEIEAWETRIQQQREALPAVLKMELKSIRDREASLADLYEQELAKARHLDVQILKEEQALARIERVQAIHDTILTQLKQLELLDAAAANGQSDVRVTALADPELSESPVWPSRTILFGACGLVGLVGGFGLVVLAEQAKAST